MPLLEGLEGSNESGAFMPVNMHQQLICVRGGAMASMQQQEDIQPESNTTAAVVNGLVKNADMQMQLEGRRCRLIQGGTTTAGKPRAVLCHTACHVDGGRSRLSLSSNQVNHGHLRPHASHQNLWMTRLQCQQRRRASLCQVKKPATLCQVSCPRVMCGMLGTRTYAHKNGHAI